MGTPRDQSLDRVLSVVDITTLIAIPIVVITWVIKPPPGGVIALSVQAFVFTGIGVLAILGRQGRATWRAQVYPVVILAGSMTGMWSSGPFAGTGVALALGAMLASAFLSRRAAIAYIALAAAAMAIRVVFATGGVGDPDRAVMAFDEIRPWLRITMVTGLVLGLGTLILHVLTRALEEAYARTVEAHRIETESQAKLDDTRQAYEEVEQVELVGRLAGGVAHDINNALTSILAASDVLVDKVATDDQRRWIAGLEGASRQAAELVRDLLWIGRRLPPSTEAAELAATVKACTARVERMSRHVALDVQLEPALRVAISPERLEQILFWLIIRARQAGVTQLALTAKREATEVAIALRGVESGTSPSASLSMRPKAVRVSLETSATREMIEQVGGTLTYIEGAGVLHVALRLPAAEPAARPVMPRALRAQTVLIVEDEPLILERLTNLITRRGYRVTSATSLAEAWPLLDHDPDLLVTDLQLGDGRGDDLAIASYRRHPARPIVICSGFGADDALLHALRGAQVRMLAKPFTRGELEEIIPQAERAASVAGVA